MTVTPIRPVPDTTQAPVAAILKLAAWRGMDGVSPRDHDAVLDALFPTHADEIREIAAKLVLGDEHIGTGERDTDFESTRWMDRSDAATEYGHWLHAEAHRAAQFVASLIVQGIR